MPSSPYALRPLDLPALGELYRGKVRDNYSLGDRMVMVTTDRVSAFDHVLGTIPFKGEVLSRLTAFWFDKVKDVAPTHLLDLPDPSVMVVKRAKALPIEFVVRGYITGSLWRDYQAGKAGAYGIAWPAGLKKDQRFDEPIITPPRRPSTASTTSPSASRRSCARGSSPRRLARGHRSRAPALRSAARSGRRAAASSSSTRSTRSASPTASSW